MLLQNQIKDLLLWGLVDLRSTHNFISASVANKSHLQIRPIHSITVSAANREKITNFRFCSSAEFSIGNHPFVVELFVFPLDGFDIVLEFKWLQTLGPIV